MRCFGFNNAAELVSNEWRASVGDIQGRSSSFCRSLKYCVGLNIFSPFRFQNTIAGLVSVTSCGPMSLIYVFFFFVLSICKRNSRQLSRRRFMFHHRNVHSVSDVTVWTGFSDSRSCRFENTEGLWAFFKLIKARKYVFNDLSFKLLLAYVYLGMN